VTPLACALKAAVQAFWAFACALDPPAVMVPARLGSIFGPTTEVSADAEGAFELPVSEVAAQPASASVPMSAKAAMLPERVIFTVFPSGMWVLSWAAQERAVADATNAA